MFYILFKFIFQGRELYTKIIRNNQEIGYLANNKYYDFNYQYINYLQQPIKLKKV